MIPKTQQVSIQTELEEWKKFDSAFIPTRASDDVFSKIKNNSCVTVTGNSGMGKTVTTRHVALKMIAEGFTIIPITHPEEMATFFSTQKKTLFVVDDLCGIYTLNQSYFDRWKLVLERENKQFCKMISSCRLQVYKDEKLKKLFIFNECECNMNSTNFSLSPEEITQFATTYFGEHSDKGIALSKEYDYFPFLCSLYQKNKNVDIDSFCKNPFQFIGEEMDNLLHEGDEGKYKYCVLVICVIHNNQLTDECLTGKNKMIEDVLDVLMADKTTSTECLHEACETLVGTFLTKDKDCYSMLHDKLFDYVSYYLGQKMTNTILRHADSAFIRERYVFDTSGIEEEKVAFTINLPDDKMETYIKRIITDWEHGKVLDFFSNRNLKSLVFTNRLIYALNKLDKSLQTELISTVDTGKLQDTPLIRSCFTGNLKLTQWILGHGVNINQCRSDGVSAFYMACQEGYVDIVRELLQYRKNNRSPLHRAWRRVRGLRNNNVKINLCDNKGRSPLYTACENGNVEEVRELLQHKLDINKCDMYGRSPLYKACQMGNVEVVRALLRLKTDVNRSVYTGMSPLFIGTVIGNEDIVTMLLENESDVNKCVSCKEVFCDAIVKYHHDKMDWYEEWWTGFIKRLVPTVLDRIDGTLLDIIIGSSPLHMACLMGYINIVNLLLEKHTDINVTNEEGATPLFLACQVGHSDVVTMLLKRGADVSICRKDGKSPSSIALENKHATITSLTSKQTWNVDN